jgi:hypothetical protein
MGKSEQVRALIRIALKAFVLVGLLVAAKYAGDQVLKQLTPHLTPSTEPALHRLIMIAITAYILLMMLPFVPGVEIGLGMMVMFGPKIAPLVYGSTVLALVFSFLIGRLVPQQSVIELFDTLRLKRAAGLLRRLHPLDADERLQFILNNRSSRIVPFLLRHRYIALMAAINLPGNALIGGGGGISLVSGFSRVFSFSGFLIAVALAVAPVPIMALVTGI